MTRRRSAVDRGEDAANSLLLPPLAAATLRSHNSLRIYLACWEPDTPLSPSEHALQRDREVVADVEGEPEDATKDRLILVSQETAATLFCLCCCGVPGQWLSFVSRPLDSTSVGAVCVHVPAGAAVLPASAQVPAALSDCSPPLAVDDVIDGVLYCVAGVCAVARCAALRRDQLVWPTANHYWRRDTGLLGFRRGSLAAPAHCSPWTRFCERDVPAAVSEWLAAGDRTAPLPGEVWRFEHHLRQPPRVHNVWKQERRAAERTPGASVPSGWRRADHITHLCHDYAEGPLLTIADLLLYPCIKQLQRALASDGLTLPTKFSSVKAWVDRLETDPVLNSVRRTMFVDNKPRCQPRSARGISNCVQPISDIEGTAKSLSDVDDAAKSLPDVGSTAKSVSDMNGTGNSVSNGDSTKKSLPDIGGSVNSLPDADGLGNSFSSMSLYRRDRESGGCRKSAAPFYSNAELCEAESRLQSLCKPLVPFPAGSTEWDRERIPDWADPASGQLPASRLQRKRHQLASVVAVLSLISKPGHRLVDFCAGGGHVALLAAAQLPDRHVAMVENKEQSAIRALHRARLVNSTASSAATRLQIYQCNMSAFEGEFEVGVALHACGEATDLVLARCLRARAAFVICPCCYGAVGGDEGAVRYPCSVAARDGGVSQRQWMAVAHAADSTHADGGEKSRRGRQYMQLVDSDRLRWAEECGYRTILTRCEPANCSDKNHLLVGVPPDWPHTPLFPHS